MADRRRIVQVLNNLLFNAARHSPDSAPIRVEAERDGSHVAVSVQDEGRGVAPERLPHMFRRYAPDDEGGGRAADGMGLGLIICRGLVEAHGGRIRAESGGIGQGARFTFTVPVAGDAWQSDPAGDRGAASGTAPAAGETARILVVDDDPQTLRYVRHTLTEAGYAVAVTGDQEQLARTVRAERPHLVLLDLVLHGADGIELMGSVPELAGLPVVFISGYGRDETIAEALRAGATDYLVKPFSPTELTARVGAALRRATRARALRPGRTGHPLRGAAGDGGWAPGRADGEGVRAAAGALAERGTRGRLRYPAGPGLERTQGGGGQPGAQSRQEAPSQAQRRHPEPGLDLQLARGRLPNARAPRRLTGPSAKGRVP